MEMIILPLSAIKSGAASHMSLQVGRSMGMTGGPLALN
jgi:hypothetical protein